MPIIVYARTAADTMIMQETGTAAVTFLEADTQKMTEVIRQCSNTVDG
jgi:hypothetical protein